MTNQEIVVHTSTTAITETNGVEFAFGDVEYLHDQGKPFVARTETPLFLTPITNMSEQKKKALQALSNTSNSAKFEDFIQRHAFANPAKEAQRAIRIGGFIGIDSPDFDNKFGSTVVTESDKQAIKKALRSTLGPTPSISTIHTCNGIEHNEISYGYRTWNKDGVQYESANGDNPMLSLTIDPNNQTISLFEGNTRDIAEIEKVINSRKNSMNKDVRLNWIASIKISAEATKDESLESLVRQLEAGLEDFNTRSDVTIGVDHEKLKAMLFSLLDLPQPNNKNLIANPYALAARDELLKLAQNDNEVAQTIADSEGFEYDQQTSSFPKTWAELRRKSQSPDLNEKVETYLFNAQLTTRENAQLINERRDLAHQRSGDRLYHKSQYQRIKHLSEIETEKAQHEQRMLLEALRLKAALTQQAVTRAQIIIEQTMSRNPIARGLGGKLGDIYPMLEQNPDALHSLDLTSPELIIFAAILNQNPVEGLENALMILGQQQLEFIAKNVPQLAEVARQALTSGYNGALLTSGETS